MTRLGAVALAFLGLLAALVAWSDEAEATTTCHATLNRCQGYAHVSTTTGGVASARCFALRTVNTAPTCTTGGITPVTTGTWELDAGACLTFYYFDTTTGATPPAAPNKLTMSFYFDDTATPVYSPFVDGPELANGQSRVFCATDTGLAGGSPRAGTYQPYIRMKKDNAPGGVGNYNIDTKGSAVVGAVVSYDKAIVRSKMFVSSVARNAYPAGATFAYGTAGDESVTVTATFTQPNGDANVETMRNFLVDKATLLAYGAAGSTVDIDATTLAQSFVVDQSFPLAGSPYVIGVSPIGNSVLGGAGVTWTVFAATGHGAGLSVYSDQAVYATADVDINPGVKLDSDGAGTYAGADESDVSKLTNSAGAVTDLFNRGETVYHEWYVMNARGELLSRAMTFAREDSANTVCASYGSLTPSSNKYSQTTNLATGGSCLAAADMTGSLRRLQVSNTDQAYQSLPGFYVSSLLVPEVHLQDVTGHANPELLAYFIRSDGMGGDDSDTIHESCLVSGVRGQVVDTSGNAVTLTVVDPDLVNRASGTSDTDSTGWTPSRSFLAITPLALDWTATCAATFNGNTGTDTDTFSINVEDGGGGETIYTGSDPLTVFALYNATSGNVHVSIASRFLNGSARLDAEDEIFFDVYNAAHALVADDQAVIEQSDGDGAYIATWEPPGDGLYEVVAHTLDPESGLPIGAHNLVIASPSTLEALMHETAFATLTGLTGSEFAAVLALAVVGVILWLRSTDVGIRAFGAVLPMVAGALVLLLTLQEGVATLWQGSIGLGAILVTLGGYLVVRLFLDDFLEKRATGEA